MSSGIQPADLAIDTAAVRTLWFGGFRVMATGTKRLQATGWGCAVGKVVRDLPALSTLPQKYCHLRRHYQRPPLDAVRPNRHWCEPHFIRRHGGAVCPASRAGNTNGLI